MTKQEQPKDSRYSILVSPPGGGQGYSLGLRPWVLRAALLLLVVLAAAIVVAAILYGRIAAQAKSAMRLKEEVAELEEQLTRLEEVQAGIQKLDGMRKEVLELTGVTERPTRDQENARLTSRDRAVPIPRESNAEPLELSPGSEDKKNRGDSEARRQKRPLAARKLTTIPCDGHVLRGFGAPRGDGFLRGVEIGASVGTRVVAAGSGTVVRAERDQLLGLTIVVDHRDGVVTVYGHNSNLFVSAGEVVEAGQAIGEIGVTGLSSSPHLYFEVRQRGKSVDPGIVFPSLVRKKDARESGRGQGEAVE